MIAALIFLALIAFTNYVVIIFTCHALKQYGAWLKKYHKVDLWCIRILVRYHWNIAQQQLKNIMQFLMLHLRPCRFRMALQHTQHGQLLPPWSTSLLCWDMMLEWPNQMQQLSLSLFFWVKLFLGKTLNSNISC